MARASTKRREDYLPSSWDDDVRMNAMFSDFRSRGVNPTDWDAKLNFWRQLLNDWSQDNNRATFTVASVRHAFCRNGRTPRGLPTVTAEMEKHGELMTLSSFVKSTSEPGWISWSWDLLVTRPMSYSWSLISSTLWPQPVNGNLEYVNLNILRAKADSILQRHQRLVEQGEEDSTVSFEVLAKHCRDICQSEKDLDLCLLLLRKDKQLTLHNEQQQKVIKFIGIGGESQQSAQLSQSEMAVVRLRSVKKTLEHQIQLHESEVERFKAEAKNQLKLGARALNLARYPTVFVKHVLCQKQQLPFAVQLDEPGMERQPITAKAALQKKKQSEVQLLKKETSLENINMLLQQLQDVGTQKAVLDALQAGSNAFKFGGMDLDRVDETMATVQETLEMQEELQEILGKSVQPQFDTSELEQELEDIIKADSNQKAYVNVNKLPTLAKSTEDISFEYPEPPTELLEDMPMSHKKGHLLL